MIIKTWRTHGIALFLLVGLMAGLVWAETLEFVTYYPATGNDLPDPLYVNSAGIGAGYNSQPVPANGLAVEGRVGMGTRTPAGLLDIRSILTAPGTPEDLLRVRGPDDGIGQVVFMPGNDVPGPGGPALNFGIGTATPLSGVDIVRPYDALYMRLRSTGVGDPDNYCAINLDADFGVVGSEADDQIWQIGHNRSATASHNFHVLYRDFNAGGGWQPVFVLQDSTNISLDVPMLAIGAYNATATIGINGNNTRMIQMERHTAPNTGGNNLTVRAGGTTVAATNRDGGNLVLSSGISTGTGASGIFMYTGIGSVSGTGDVVPTLQTVRLAIAGNGNVGIGLLNPGSALTVYRNGDAAYQSIWGTGDGDNFSALNLVSDEATDKFWQISHKQAAGVVNKFQIAYNNGVSWSFPFTITPGEFVGLGTDSPTEKLHVIGNILASGTITPSDVRLKSHIEPLTGVLQKIDAIEGVSYDWNDLYKAKGYPVLPERKEIGVIAQDVEKVFPELVYTSDGYKGLDYGKFTAVLLQAVKELKAENTSLKKRIEVLEKKENLP